MNRNDTEFMVQKIRTQYVEKDESEKNLDMLRELDAEVKRPANVFGYVFGSIGAIVMGAGMSLVMTDIGAQLGITNTMPVGIAIGVVGMLMAIVNYPIYKKILSSRKKKYADRIFELSEKIMGGEK
ncbi:MAG: dihydropteridine reductase [Ruminiclostridium sp.]|nr:dihydropteridine reductase [Ruminiclostridium sp.]